MVWFIICFLMLVPFLSMLWIFEILLNFQAVIESQAREEEEGDQSSAEEETEVWKRYSLYGEMKWWPCFPLKVWWYTRKVSCGKRKARVWKKDICTHKVHEEKTDFNWLCLASVNVFCGKVEGNVLLVFYTYKYQKIVLCINCGIQYSSASAPCSAVTQIKCPRHRK